MLIRERTHFPRQLLEKLTKLKLISQTGRAGPHIDMDACTRLGIAVAETTGAPTATAELTWALIMAAMRRLPQYIGNLEAVGITNVEVAGSKKHLQQLLKAYRRGLIVSSRRTEYLRPADHVRR